MNVLFVAILATATPAGGSSLELADLGEYRKALDRSPGAPAAPVRFRDLWDRPEQYRGKSVKVEGRVVRRFRQDPVGTFPALVEAWTRDERGDLLCLVFPDADAASSAPGRLVRFEGTYLKRLRYPGGDQDRLAPLIVGPRPPTPIEPEVPEAAGRAGWGWSPSPLDWTIGLLIAGLVTLALIRQHLRRPLARPMGVGPEPEFWDEPKGDRADGG